MRRIRSGCAAALLLLSTPAIHAAPSVHVNATAQAGVVGNPGDTDSSEVFGTTAIGTSASAEMSAVITPTSNFFVAGSSAAGAWPGYIAASANSVLQSTHTGTLTFLLDNLAGGAGQVTADFFVGDLVVTATGGGGLTTVPIALNLQVSGSLSADGSLNQPPEFSPPSAPVGRGR